MNYKTANHKVYTALLSALFLLSACGTTAKDNTANLSAEKLYAQAREEADSGSNEQAIKLYERVEGRAAGGLLGQQAQLQRAYLLYRSDERAEALAIVERFLKLHPTSPGADYAFYLQGLIHFNDNLGFFGKLAKRDLSERDQQASRDAYQAFKQLVELYPESKYAADAQARMAYIVGSLAKYELHVANYYFKRGAFIASANRAQQVVQEFGHTSAAEDALGIMVQSYHRLGLTQLRDDATRVLEKNFPNSRLLGKN
jgi:outer membrane protein assembly factor BamD